VFRRPRRRDLIWLSLGLVAGVIGQIVLGGITVLFNLAPPLVAGHYLLSLVLVWNALVLVRRSWVPDGVVPERRASPQLQALARLLFALVWVSVVAGTVVTGSGPHAGDENAPRYNLSIVDTTRIHGVAVWMFLAVTVITVWFAWRTNAARSICRALNVLLGAIIVQAAIGYTQYALGVPAGLVALHIAGSVFVFLATVWVLLALTDWTVQLPDEHSRTRPRSASVPV
jgi:cytochrome c oxidase assembly protein subunit 15